MGDVSDVDDIAMYRYGYTENLCCCGQFVFNKAKLALDDRGSVGSVGSLGSLAGYCAGALPR